MYRQRRTAALFLLLFFSGPLLRPDPLHGRQDQASPRVAVQAVRGGVHLLRGAGGNVVLFLGEDGILLVDAGVVELGPAVLAVARETAAAEGANPTLRYLVNTHWHFDHTGGNGAMAAAGATIVAHERVLRALSETRILAALDGRVVEPLPPEARPTLTFNNRLNLAWNGDLLHLVHMPAAHSDGDLVVQFRDANVMHLGDLFFNGMYPYIDVDYGGNLEGIVRGLEDILAHTLENTLYIPGHGPLGTRADLQAYLHMLKTVGDRVREMVERGLTREAVVAARPSAEFDAVWGQARGFPQPDNWVGLVYDGMVRAGGGEASGSR